jgi:hypothetical protein
VIGASAGCRRAQHVGDDDDHDEHDRISSTMVTVIATMTMMMIGVSSMARPFPAGAAAADDAIAALCGTAPPTGRGR